MIKVIASVILAYLLGYMLNGFISGTPLFPNILPYGTWAAVAVALSVALWGRTLKTLFYNPQITVLDILEFNQTPSLNVWRLPFTNKGNDTAKDVQVEIIEVIDDKNKKRENFLPIPLRWTHLGEESRDILRGQTAYLDVFEHISQGKQVTNLSHYLKFGSRFAQEIKDFCFLKPGKSQIKLRLFQQNGDTLEIVVNAEWDGQHIFDAGLQGKEMYWEIKNKETTDNN